MGNDVDAEVILGIRTTMCQLFEDLQEKYPEELYAFVMDELESLDEECDRLSDRQDQIDFLQVYKDRLVDPDSFNKKIYIKCEAISYIDAWKVEMNAKKDEEIRCDDIRKAQEELKKYIEEKEMKDAEVVVILRVCRTA